MGTVIVSLILILVVGGIICKLVKDKRSGKSGCSGNCAHCGSACASKGMGSKKK